MKDRCDVAHFVFFLHRESKRRRPNRDCIAVRELCFDDAFAIHKGAVGRVHVEDMVGGIDALDLAVGGRNFGIIDQDVTFFATENGGVTTKFKRRICVPTRDELKYGSELRLFLCCL